MNRKYLLWLLLLVANHPLFAQDSTITPKKKFDTTFIQNYKEYLTLGIFTLSPIEYLNIHTLDKNNPKDYNLKTNIAASIGFTAAYKSIFVAFAFRTSLDAQSIETYGKSRFNGFGIKVNNRKFNLTFESGKVKGFYYENQNYQDANNNQKYVTRPDLLEKHYSFNGVYNFNHKKYSILAPFNYTERQLKSKVGFLLKASVSKNLITSDSSITTANTNQSTNFNRLAFTSYKIGPGIGINLVLIKRMYVSFLFYMSSNLVFYNYSNNGENKKYDHAFTTFLEGRFAMGYQSKRFYIGMHINSDRILFKNEFVKIEKIRQMVNISIGYRFGAPKLLKEAYKATLTRYLGL